MGHFLTSIWAFKVSLTVALILLWWGYNQRRSLQRHMIFGISGVVLTVLTAIYLIVLVEGFGIQFQSRYPLYVVHAHRLFSAVTLLLVVQQLITGLARRPIHKWMPPAVLTFYAVSVASGWVLF